MSISNLSHDTFEAIGIEPIPDGETVKAQFKSLSVYEIQGIYSDKLSPLEPHKLVHVEKDFSFSVGENINIVCQTLTGIDFIKDSGKWRKDKKATPPFLVVMIQLNEIAICKSGYWKLEDEKIITYNCFPKARDTLNQLTKKIAAQLTTSLTVVLSSDENPVIFLPLDRIFFAETNHGKILNDTCLMDIGKVIPCKSLSVDSFNIEIQKALELYNDFHPKIGCFFELAIKSDDPLKRFIYFFLAIEVHTHQTFKRLNYDSSVPFMNAMPQRMKSSVVDFFVDNQKQSKTLLQRFIRCSILKWDNINDQDIQRFRTIKRLRDEIYHGEKTPESTLPIGEAQKLVLKLLAHHQD